MPARDTQQADPRARRLGLLILAGGTVIGAVLIVVAGIYRPTLEDWVAGDPRPRVRLVLGIVAAAVALPGVGVAVYLWRIGDRAIRAERFPPPDTRVVRDTPVLRGGAARRRGRTVQFLAAVLILAVAGVMLLSLRLVSLLERAG